MNSAYNEMITARTLKVHSLQSQIAELKDRYAFGTNVPADDASLSAAVAELRGIIFPS